MTHFGVSQMWVTEEAEFSASFLLMTVGRIGSADDDVRGKTWHVDQAC